MNFVIFYIIIALCIMTAIIPFATKSHKKTSSPIVEKSHQWHEPRGEYTKDHTDRVDLKKIHHAEPEPGYVVLNGVKRRIEDCKYL